MSNGANHTEEVAKSMQYGGTGGTLLGTAWAWLAENAVQLGVLFALVSMLCTVLGTIWIIKTKRLETKHKIIQMEIDRAKLEALQKG